MILKFVLVDSKVSTPKTLPSIVTLSISKVILLMLVISSLISLPMMNGSSFFGGLGISLIFSFSISFRVSIDFSLFILVSILIGNPALFSFFSRSSLILENFISSALLATSTFKVFPSNSILFSRNIESKGASLLYSSIR